MEDIQIKISAAVESAQAATTIGQLKKSLVELQDIAENNDLGAEQFKALQQQVVSTNQTLASARDKVGDIQDKISTLQGTPVERLNNSFNLLRQSIFSLDFDKAKIGVQGLVDAFTPLGPDGAPLKGLAALGPTLKGLSSGVASLGQTFIQLGKTLLTNPIFLLATVISAVVVGIVALLNNLGLLKPILDAIGNAVEFVTDAFNFLTEAIGLTTAASDKHLAQVVENTDKELEEIERISKAQIQLSTTLQGLNSLQVRDVEKLTGLYLQQGESLDTIKRKAAEARKSELESAIKAFDAIKAKNGSLNEDQLEKLDNYKQKYQETVNTIVEIETARVRKVIDLEKQVQEGKINAIQDDLERAKARSKFEKEQAQSSRDEIAILLQEEVILKQTNETDKANIVRRQIKALTEERQLKEAAAERELARVKTNIANESAAKRKAREDKEAAERKKAAQDELKALIEIEDVKVIKAKDGSKEKLDAEIARIIKIEDFESKNAKLLDITDTNLAKKKAENQESISILSEKFYNDEAARNAKIIELNKEIEKAKYDTGFRTFANAKALIKAELDLEKFKKDQIVNNANSTTQEKILAEANFFKASNKAMSDEMALYNEFRDNIENRTNDYYDLYDQRLIESKSKIEGLYNEEINQVRNTDEIKKRILEQSYQLELKLLKNSLDADNAENATFNYKKSAIDAEYAKKKVDLEKLTSDQILQIRKRQEDETLRLIDSGFRAAQGLSDAVFAIKMRNLKKGSVEEEKAARQQFNVNKALQLGLAVIDGYKAITSSLSQSPVAIGPVPNPAGIASLAFAVTTTAANIAKILASKFQPSGGGASAPTAPTVNINGETPTTTAAPAEFSAPTFFNLGEERQATTVGQNQQRVFVLETDITSTQNRVSVIENRSVIS